VETDEVTSLIKSGKLTTEFAIPKVDEVSFLQYETIKVNDKGQTMADIKYDKLSLGERAALDYIVFKNMKIPTISKSNVMDRFRTAKKSNEQRKVIIKPTATNPSFAGLNFRELAKGKNII
jgi:hypothetical protein